MTDLDTFEPATASQNRAVVLMLRGSLRLLDALRLQEAITERLAKGYDRIVIDLRAVDGAEPALLLPLLRGRRRAALTGGRLVVVADRTELEALLGRIGLDAILSTDRTLDAALNGKPSETIEVSSCKQ
jgi:anti-anti-sigma regulatory factor